MKTFITLCILTFAVQMNSQITPYGDNYLYQGTSYKASKLGPIIEKDKLAYHFYKDWKKSGSGINYIMGGVLVMSTGYALTQSGKDRDALYQLLVRPFNLVFGATILLSGIGISTFGLTKLKKEEYSLILAIDRFNEVESINIKEIKKNAINIDLGYSGGNIGLFVSF